MDGLSYPPSSEQEMVFSEGGLTFIMLPLTSAGNFRAVYGPQAFESLVQKIKSVISDFFQGQKMVTVTKTRSQREELSYQGSFQEVVFQDNQIDEPSVDEHKGVQIISFVDTSEFEDTHFSLRFQSEDGQQRTENIYFFRSSVIVDVPQKNMTITTTIGGPESAETESIVIASK